MIELAGRPYHGVVTALASCREARRYMVNRRLRVVVIGLVARHAGRARQVVIVIHVALSALRRRVRSSQCPAGRGMIELPSRPHNSVVAVLASCGEAQRNVVYRRLRVVVVRLVARHACRIRQLVVIVNVA